jgi:hypothetical protein
VIFRVAAGQTNKQIAADLGVSEVMVKVHRAHGMRKMNAKSVADLVRMSDLLQNGTAVSSQSVWGVFKDHGPVTPTQRPRQSDPRPRFQESSVWFQPQVTYGSDRSHLSVNAAAISRLLKSGDLEKGLFSPSIERDHGRQLRVESSLLRLHSKNARRARLLRARCARHR